MNVSQAIGQNVTIQIVHGFVDNGLGGNPAGVTGQAKHLTTAAALGLGTDDPAHIEMRELAL